MKGKNLDIFFSKTIQQKQIETRHMSSSPHGIINDIIGEVVFKPEVESKSETSYT